MVVDPFDQSIDKAAVFGPPRREPLASQIRETKVGHHSVAEKFRDMTVEAFDRIGCHSLGCVSARGHGGPLCYSQIGGLCPATIIELIMVKVPYAIFVVDWQS
jgi:hypothetical protein